VVVSWSTFGWQPLSTMDIERHNQRQVDRLNQRGGRMLGAGGRQRPGAAGGNQGGQGCEPSDECHVRPAAALLVRQSGGDRRIARVWPAIADLLRAKFPDLVEPYRKILFDQVARTLDLNELRGRVDDAARRKSLTNRLAACM
jgi:hypothetical protein